MEKPTATPRPKTEATSSNASKTIINDISAEYVSAISAFFQKVGVSHSNSIPDFCNTKYFYSHLIRDAIKPDQVLRGRITCHLTVTPILAVTISPLFFSNSSFFFFFFIKSRIFLFVFSWDLQNFYASLHGGAVAAIAEMVSIACARTVVAEDNGIFLGDMSISYLSAAPIHVSFLGSLFGCSVCASFNSFLVLSTSTN